MTPVSQDPLRRPVTNPESLILQLYGPLWVLARQFWETNSPQPLPRGGEPSASLGEGFTDLVGQTSAELDLKDREAVFAFFAKTKPRYVVLAAAKVGGILANSTFPVEFLSDNLRIQVNVLDAALEHGVERLLFLGSSCIYPKLATQPITEDALLTGYLEPTNDAYAIAKIAGILQIQAARRQHGLPWISAMPTNLYGPGDNFSPAGSHVLPALIRRSGQRYRPDRYRPGQRRQTPPTHSCATCPAQPRSLAPSYPQREAQSRASH